MADTAAVKSIPLMTVTDGKFQDDSLPTDSVLPPGTYIDGESNGVKTPSLNKGVFPDDGNVPDLTLAPTETTLVMQRTASVSEMVTSMHQMERSAEVNVERPSLLLGDLKSETKVCTSVATGGTVDRHFENVTSFYFDSENPPESVSWVQMDSDADTWTPFVDGSMVPETQKQEWDAIFSSISKLKEHINNEIGSFMNLSPYLSRLDGLPIAI